MNKQIINQLQEELDSRGKYGRVDTKSRLVLHDNENIYIYLRESGVTEYVSYTPELYYLLSCPCYCSYSYDYKQERAKVELAISLYKGRNRNKVNLARMVLLWYEYGQSVEKFVKDFPKIKKTIGEADHINSDKHNHCVWNLSKSVRAENRGKSDLAGRIKPPYFCYFAVTLNKKYRVCFGYRTIFRWGQQMYLQFDSLSSLTDFLRSVMSMTKAAAFMKKYGTPAEVYRADKKAIYAAENFQAAAYYAKRLISMSDDDFMKWEVGSKIVVR